jgi:nicotinamidase-related amidase
VLPKTQPNFFFGTPLRGVLAALSADVILLTGVATDLGILATARGAVLAGIFPVTIVDAVGTFSEEQQERGLSQLAELGDVCTSQQVLDAWRTRE